MLLQRKQWYDYVWVFKKNVFFKHKNELVSIELWFNLQILNRRLESRPLVTLLPVFTHYWQTNLTYKIGSRHIRQVIRLNMLYMASTYKTFHRSWRRSSYIFCFLVHQMIPLWHFQTELWHLSCAFHRQWYIKNWKFTFKKGLKKKSTWSATHHSINRDQWWT